MGVICYFIFKQIDNGDVILKKKRGLTVENSFVSALRFIYDSSVKLISIKWLKKKKIGFYARLQSLIVVVISEMFVRLTF